MSTDCVVEIWPGVFVWRAFNKQESIIISDEDQSSGDEECM